MYLKNVIYILKKYLVCSCIKPWLGPKLSLSRPKHTSLAQASVLASRGLEKLSLASSFQAVLSWHITIAEG